jgi:small subunit ribosomal protein S13
VADKAKKAKEPKADKNSKEPQVEQEEPTTTTEVEQEQPTQPDEETTVEEQDEQESDEEQVESDEETETKDTKDTAPAKKTDEKTKKEPKKKDGHPDDFKYIIRIANTDINGEKTIEFGLAQIKGIGRHMSTLILQHAGIDKKIKVGDLTDKQIDTIKAILEKITEISPIWMMNHRKEQRSGENIHLLSTDLDTRIRDDVNLMKMIRSYRGIRHEQGLPVRGQRTRANNRTGLAMGVSKKRE